MNPPYGRDLPRWMQKAYRESIDNHALVVCLVPARVGALWWQDTAAKAEVRFPVGRIRFEGAKDEAPFEAAIVIFRPRPQPFDPYALEWFLGIKGKFQEE